jgi:SAM-dependent methyltransferase
MRRLNLGAGGDILAGWVNTDIVALPGIDMIWDLDIGPWPWENGSITEVRAVDVFEHVADPILFMCECWRVLKPGGVVRIRSPHWKHENAYTDPCHRRYCTERTWDYWIRGTEFHGKYGAAYCGDGVLFERVLLELTDGNSNISLTLRRLHSAQ